jgi:hypothetical protein
MAEAVAWPVYLACELIATEFCFFVTSVKRRSNSTYNFADRYTNSLCNPKSGTLVQLGEERFH